MLSICGMRNCGILAMRLFSANHNASAFRCSARKASAIPRLVMPASLCLLSLNHIQVSFVRYVKYHLTPSPRSRSFLTHYPLQNSPLFTQIYPSSPPKVILFYSKISFFYPIFNFFPLYSCIIHLFSLPLHPHSLNQSLGDS